MMKMRCFFLIMLFCTSQTAIAQWQWAAIGNNVGDAFCTDVTVDVANNIYVTGTYSTSLSLGSTILNSLGMTDIFVAKYNPSGQLLWAKTMGGFTADIGGGIITDNAGNVYVASSFSDTAIYLGKGFRSIGDLDINLTKLNSNGDLLWSKSWGSIYPDYGIKVALGTQNDILLSGYYAAYAGSPTTYEHITFDAVTLTSSGDADIFIAKVDTGGGIKWASSGGGKASDVAVDLFTDSNGNSYITGYFTGSKIGFGSINLSAKGVLGDMFVVKYDNNGIPVWANGAGADNDVTGNAIAVNKNGEVYVAGSTYSSTYIDFGSVMFHDKSFVAKYDASGNFSWAKSIGVLSKDYVRDMTIDDSGNLIIAGYFDSNNKFGSDSVVSKGKNDAFASKIDKDGNCLWGATAGGSDNDAAFSIAIDKRGDIVVAGYVASSPADFGNSHITASNAWDMVVAKLSGATTNIKQLNVSNGDYVVWPNPNNGQFKIYVKHSAFTLLVVTNMAGQIIHQQFLQQGVNSIDLTEQSIGTYNLSISGKNNFLNLKMILQP